MSSLIRYYKKLNQSSYWNFLSLIASGNSTNSHGSAANLLLEDIGITDYYGELLTLVNGKVVPPKSPISSELVYSHTNSLMTILSYGALGLIGCLAIKHELIIHLNKKRKKEWEKMSDKEKSRFKEFKIKILNFKEKLSKRNLSLITSFIIAVCLPWFLTFLILIFSGVWSSLVSAVSNDGNLLFAMTIFYSFNYTFDLALLGNGFWLVSLIWSITGLSIGFLTRDVKTSLISALFGLGINFFLYIVLINNKTAGPFLPTELIDPLLFPRLYSNFGVETLYFLFLQISSEIFILPLLITFALFSALLNPKVEKTTYFR